MEVDERRVAAIVAEVVRKLKSGGSPASLETGAGGVFATVDEALAAATEAQRALAGLGRQRRASLVSALRIAGEAQAEALAHTAHEVTGMGRVADKIQKNLNAARLSPGVEDLVVSARSDDRGLIVEEYAPFGVIVDVTPATHPTAMIINHAIIFVAGGNAAFVAPHPRAQAATLAAIRALNDAVVKAGGPPNVLTAVASGTMETVEAAMKHPLTRLVTAAGGPGVVKAALTSGKKAIVAGPGNPPVVVDETADLQAAAAAILDGATFDNNLLCIAEKAVFAVGTVADDLLRAMALAGGQVLKPAEAAAVTRLVVRDGHLNADFIGRDAEVILKTAGIAPQPGTRCALMEVDEGHPLVSLEQLMPVLPIVRVPDFAAAVEAAFRTEHGFGHTALIHSRDAQRVSYYGRRLNTTLLVANAPSGAALGVGSAGVFGHTIASSASGEGVCTPRSFCRRRAVLNAAERVC